MITGSAILLLAAAPAASPRVDGVYRLTGFHDTASELLLRPDGRFEFGLAEGALDEESSGHWTREGGKVVLVTEPKPVAPVFSPGPVSTTAEHGFLLKIVWPDGHGVPLVDFHLLYADGSSDEGYTQEDGWSTDDRRVPKSIQLAVTMHGLVSPVFALDPVKGNAFTFVLTPNDLGRLDFDRLPLDISPGRLVMHRGDQDFVYIREGSGQR